MDDWSNTCWAWRHRHRLTQAEAAEWCCVSLTTWSRWERGRTEPPVETARRIVEEFRSKDRFLAASMATPGLYATDDPNVFMSVR